MSGPMREPGFDGRLEEGRAFQDLVADLLWARGLAICNFTSRARALRAENRQGIEIKQDHAFRRTGRLFVEVAKRPGPGCDFLPSGIAGPGRPWALILGDPRAIWFLPTVSLRLVEGRCQRAENDFGRGFLLPLTEADRIAAFKIETNGGSHA